MPLNAWVRAEPIRLRPRPPAGFLLLDLGGGWCFAESLELPLPARDALDRD
jgi:hypothetical protein